MYIGSLFSGIGGLELGLEQSGLGEVVWQVEKDEFCREVLAQHWPCAERFSDVRTVGRSNLRHVDLICGGFPCQDLSSAGKRAGLCGDQSGLWFEYLRIVTEMRPEWVVVENVASGAHEWVDEIVKDLGQQGYACLPIPLSAQDVGAPHARARIFVVARHADANSESVVPQYAEAPRMQNVTRRLPGWSQRPRLRMVDGVSRKLAALGNAVVPQCAEVIGYVIQELVLRSRTCTNSCS